MSQQGQWKASALAATFSSNSGFNGTAWGAARPQLHMGSDVGFGLGFGQTQILNNLSMASGYRYGSNTHISDGLAAVATGGSTGIRSQKRKASIEDESMDGSSSPTPEPISRKVRGLSDLRRHGQHVSKTQYSSGISAPADGRKRTRMMDADAPSEVSLDKLIEPLEEKDLRSLLETLISQNPHLASQVRQLVPKPTVNSACSQLVRLERHMQASFPYSKSGPASDDYAYHRVRPALEELRDTIVMYLDHFTHYGLVGASAQHTADQPPNALSHPAEWFDLLAQATGVAMRMPKWDKPENNDIRRDTLRQLADGWLRAIMAAARWTEEGHIVGKDMLSQWAQQLDHFSTASGEDSLFQPAIQVFQQSFGRNYARALGRMSLGSTA